MRSFFQKYRLVLGASFPFLVVGLATLVTLIPGDLDEFYWSKKRACLCDQNGSFLRFHDGKFITYNTHHRIADYSGRYEKRSDGRIHVFEQNSFGEKEEKTMVISPKLFGCWIHYSYSESSEWCWRANRQNEIDFAVRTLPVVAYQSDGEDYVRTHYDDQFKVTKVERIPRKKSKERPSTPKIEPEGRE